MSPRSSATYALCCMAIYGLYASFQSPVPNHASGASETYDPELLSLYTIVEIFTTLRLLHLLLLPFFNLVSGPTPTLQKFIRDVLMSWGWLMAVYLLFIALKTYFDIGNVKYAEVVGMTRNYSAVGSLWILLYVVFSQLPDF
ncbi:hypothetical protein ANO14919_123030 [Xylariales sp. No.14919]|nr:hypothetical protein F5X98DRAFT_165599 [Xylaria grammica]GAW22760.1 hypothetical protein ANO14919_123030 [Xylariales sp. No.14919]